MKKIMVLALALLGCLGLCCGCAYEFVDNDAPVANEKAVLYGATDMEHLLTTVPEDYQLIVAGNTEEEVFVSSDQFKELKEQMVEAELAFGYTPAESEETLYGSYKVKGVPLAYFLNEAGMLDSTVAVIVRGTDGYERIFTKDELEADHTMLLRWHEATGFQLIHDVAPAGETANCQEWIKYVQVILPLDAANYAAYVEQNELWDGEVFALEALVDRYQPIDLPLDYQLKISGLVDIETALEFEDLKNQIWMTDYVKVFPYLIETELETLQGGVIVAGLPLRDLIAEAGMSEDTAAFTVKTASGDQTTFTLDWLYWDFASELDMVLTYQDGMGLCLIYPDNNEDGQIDPSRWLFGVTEIELIDRESAEAKGFIFE